MSAGSSSRWFGVAFVWAVILALGWFGYRYFFALRQAAESQYQAAVSEYEQLSRRARQRNIAPPPFAEDADLEQVRAMSEYLKELLLQPESDTPIRSHLALALDSFSGYAVFRSAEFNQQVRQRGLGLRVVDDGADYNRRIRSLKSGETPLAVFTIDALIKASATLGETPGVIVMLIDETTGADAMIAYKQAIPNVDALNRPDTRFVVTRDSPSETLARVVLAEFDLPALERGDLWIEANGAEDVLKRFRAADKTQPYAYVLWEPYVSMALETPGAHRLIDSSKFTGRIVDVLVAQREFLEAHADQVESFVEAYLRSAYHVRRTMVELVSKDTQRLGQRLTPTQAEQLVHGVWWKNTQENYAHLGIIPIGDVRGITPISGMIQKIGDVLLATGAIASDPTGGDAEKLYSPGILRDLYEKRFHPNVTGGKDEQLRTLEPVRALSDEEWSQLTTVGRLPVERIVFYRGSSRITELSKSTLNRLVETLQSWPQYYLLVQGNSLNLGDDPEANRQVAEDRARAVADFLIEAGIENTRIRSVAAQTNTNDAPSVTFVLGQPPY